VFVIGGSVVSAFNDLPGKALLFRKLDVLKGVSFND